MEFYRPQTEKEKKQRQSLRKIFVFGGLFVFLALVGSVIYAVRYSGIFKVSTVSISGLQAGSSEKLTAALENFFVENYKVSSVLGIKNILAWKTETDDFLNSYPQFENLEIRKNYFRGEIAINVKERQRFGIWCQTQMNSDRTQINSEFCGWFDRNGIIFGEAPVIETEILNRANDLSGRDIKIGGTVLPDNLRANLISIFDVLDAAEINTKTVYFDDPILEEVSTQATAGDPKIFFSLRFDPKFSLAAINSLKQSGQWKKLNYADFRVENRAYYK